MGSTAIEVREAQKALAEAALEAHKAVLTEAKLDEKAQSRDPKLRALKAKVKKSQQRLTAIAARQAHVDEMKAEREKAKAAPKEKKAKGGKKAAPAPAAGGKKKEKKKK